MTNEATIEVSTPTLAVHEPPEAVRNHLEALTGLRIFAALAVFGSHLPIPANVPGFAPLHAGYYGVTFFFVLSGFLLAINYFERLRHPTPRKLLAFVVARFARVYPLYLLVLAAEFTRCWMTGKTTGRWLEHVLALQAWDPSLDVAYRFNGPGWSIGVEFFLYATLPLLILGIAWLDRRGWRTVLAVVLVVVVMGVIVLWFQNTGRSDLPNTDSASGHRWLYRMPLMRMGDFVLGILAARIYVRSRHRRETERFGWLLIVAALVATATLASAPGLLLNVWTWDFGYAIPAAALFLGLAWAPRNPVARLFALPLIVLFGEASYAFYLIHVRVLGLLNVGSWGNGLALNVLSVLVALVVTLLAAIALHLGIERPAQSWIRGLVKQPGRQRDTPVLSSSTRDSA